MNFAISRSPRWTPGLSISRILTREGAAVPVALHCREVTPAPSGAALSNGRLESGPRAASSGRGSACTEVSSWSGPRREPRRLGEEQCGPPLWPSRTCPASYTPRRVDGHEETPGLLSAMRCRSHGWQRTAPPLGAAACVRHSTWYRTGPVQRSRDACTVPWVSLAYPAPPLISTERCTNTAPGS